MMIRNRNRILMLYIIGVLCPVFFLMISSLVFAYSHEPNLDEFTFDNFREWRSHNHTVFKYEPIISVRSESDHGWIKLLNLILDPINITVRNTIVFGWSEETGGYEKVDKKTTFYLKHASSGQDEKSLSADMNNDSVDEKFDLADGRLKVYEDNNLLWESPDSQWVDSFEVADSTHDGVLDLNISLWKSGSFGRSKPFWIDENDIRVRNHLFVMRMWKGKIKSEWCSSALPCPNLEFVFADLDNDNLQELVVIEGSYDDFPKFIGRYVAVWKWSSWGFYNEWRSDSGEYSNLRVKRCGDKSIILVDFQ